MYAVALVWIVGLTVALPATAGATSPCTIAGTSEADVLRGGSGPDVICGGGGADSIYGGGGNDRLVGGPGKDTLRGGSGDDRIVGGDGNDVLSGGPGGDLMDGGAGTDLVDFAAAQHGVSVDLGSGTAGGDGADKLQQAESVIGSAGADVLAGDGSTNKLVGGAGDDTLQGRGGNDAMQAGEGDDDLWGGVGNDRLSGGGDDDMLDGGGGTNTCNGGAGHDVLKPNCDSRAPVVRSLSVSPGTVNTSEGPVTLTFTARVTDDLAGASGGAVTLRSPTESQWAIARWTSDNLVSGDSLDGAYLFEVTLPQYSEQGTWVASEVYAGDQVGNGESLWLDIDSQLQNAGLDISFVQEGAGDLTPPVVQSMTISTDTVDTGSGPAKIVVEARITDALSGVRHGRVIFNSPSWDQSVGALFNAETLVSGTVKNGIYRTEISVPRYAEQGLWKVDAVYANDDAGNGRTYQYRAIADAGLDLAFEQTAPGDAIPPVLQSTSFSPTDISTSDAPATVVVEARITDALAGLSSAEIDVCDAAQLHRQSGTVTWQDRVSGTARDGVYRKEIVIPRYSALGQWSVCHAYLRDAAGNTRSAFSFSDAFAAFYNHP